MWWTVRPYERSDAAIDEAGGYDGDVHRFHVGNRRTHRLKFTYEKLVSLGISGIVMADTIEEVHTLAQRAGEDMQEIQTFLGDQKYVEEARIRFPRGYVRTAAGIYNRLPQIGDNTKRRNFAYQLMRADVVRWLLTRTDVWGQIQSVLVAEYICILAYGIEFFVKTLNYRKVAAKRPMGAHTQRLVDTKIISPVLKVELDWMWGVRTHEHLDATTDLRHCSHDRTDFNRAIVAWNEFIKRMQAPQFGFVDES